MASAPFSTAARTHSQSPAGASSSGKRAGGRGARTDSGANALRSAAATGLFSLPCISESELTLQSPGEQRVILERHTPLGSRREYPFDRLSALVPDTNENIAPENPS